MPDGRTQLTEQQLTELRRWADRLVAGGADGELATFASAIGPLSDEVARLRVAPVSAPAPGIEVASLRHRAESTLTNGAPGQVRAAARAVVLLCDDIAAHERPTRRRLSAARRRRRLLVVAGGAVFVAAAAFVAFRGGQDGLDPAGPASATVSKDELPTLVFSAAGDATDAAATSWRLDGRPVDSRVGVRDDRLVFRPRGLEDGAHVLEVSRPGGLFSDTRASWSFTVDTKAPPIRVTKGSLDARRGVPYTLSGAVEPGARLRVNGAHASLDQRGRFSVAFAQPPARTVVLVAHDEAGNVTDSRLKVGTAARLPRSPIRAVHVTADAWAHDGLRGEVLRLLSQRRINAVELDLKDELGIIGWRSGVPLARTIGAERATYDLGAAVRLLHARGARVIGRLVAFRDPVLAQWAWTHGRRELVVQTPDGGAYSGGYGGFTNFVHPAVHAYNVQVAVAAAKLGVDDILYDYVRRPDGPLESMVVPGLEGDAAFAVADFLAEARRRLTPSGAFLGASVFGIAATRPDEIAQDVGAIARNVDYVAPMLYPSHWGPQE